MLGMLALWELLLPKHGHVLFVNRSPSAPCNFNAATSRGIHFSFY
jgi:hypothetical protein